MTLTNILLLLLLGPVALIVGVFGAVFIVAYVCAWLAEK